MEEVKEDKSFSLKMGGGHIHMDSTDSESMETGDSGRQSGGKS